MNVGTLEIKLLANLARLQTDMDRANQTVDRAMGKINKSVVTAKNAFAGLTAAFGGAQILRMLDEYKKFDAQLKISTRSTKEYAAAYKSVVDVARQSQSDISAVGVFYARLTNNLRDFGTSQKEIAGITEAVALSLRVSNATVQETNSVMLQLSQSFGSGRINGQEFLAVSEGAPIIMRQLAKSLNTTVGALKDMSAQGKLTSDVLAKALADPEYIAMLREQVKEVGTISSAWTVFMNNLKQYLGEADKTKGASDLIRKGILALGDSLNTLVTVGLAAAGVAFARWATSLYESAKAQAALIASQQAAANQKVVLARAAVTLAEAEYRAASAIGASTLALNNNAAATTNAARAAAVLTAAQGRLAATTATATAAAGLFGRTLAFLGGPIGIAIAGVILFGDKIVEWINKTRGMTPALKAINDELDRQNKLRERGISIKDPLAEEKSEVQDLQKAIADLTAQRKRYQEIAKNPDAATFGERTVLGATGDSVQKRASDLAVDTQNRLRIAYEKLADAQKVVTTENVKQTASFAELTEGLKLASEQAAEYEKQSKLIREAGLREGKTEAQIAEALTALKVKLLGKETASTKEAQDALKDYFERTNKAIVEQIELREKMYRDDEQYVADMVNVQVDATQAIYDQIDATRTEIAERGKLESAIQATALARVVEKRVAMEARGEFTEGVEQEIEARKKLLDLTIKKERIEAEEKAAEETKRIWEKAEEEKRREFEKTVDAIDRTFMESFRELINGGENSWKSFTKSLFTTFKTTVADQIYKLFAQPFIVKLVASIIGVSASGSASAGGLLESITGGGESGGGIFGTISDGLSKLNSDVVGSIGKLGTFLSSGNGGLADKIGGFLGQYSSEIATGLAFAPAAFSLLKGDIKGAAFQGGGAAIGLALGGPVGGAIGSFLGGALGGLFGNSGERFEQEGDARKAVIRNGKLRASNYAVFGGRMNATNDFLDKVNATFLNNFNSLAKEFDAKQLRRTVAGFRVRRTSGAIATDFRFGGGGISSGRLSDEFGKDRDIAGALELYGKKVLGEYLVKAITMSSLPKGIKKYFNGLTDQKAVTSAINSILNLRSAIEFLPPIFQNLNKALLATKYNVSLKWLEEDFAATQKYTELFYSQEEQFASFTNQLNGAFANLNLTLPDTREGFRQLVDGIKVVNEETYAQYSALVRLAPSMAQYYEYLEQQNQATDALVNSLNQLDPNKFRSTFEFTRAQVYAKSGIPLSMLPSYDVGTPYVPKTGPAIIHQGERILTRRENADFTGMVGELRNMRSELQSIAVTNAKLQKSVDRLEKDGFIVRDVGADGQPQILQVEVVA